VKVWTISGFPGHWPVGTAAVVVAETAEHAASLLNDELQARELGRPVEAASMKLLPLVEPVAHVLCDGDY
jgi:hypothetical protein